jgi:hypothetical protein
MTLYYDILNIDKKDYLPCWYLYMDLIETRYNIEPVNFYDWDSINFHDDYHHIYYLLKDMEANINIIIPIIENIIVDTINLENYNSLVKCDTCGRIWDGYAQCMCD